MMIKVSGYSDDVVDIEGGTQWWIEEIDAYGQDVIIYFNDGTILRMTYDGAWKSRGREGRNSKAHHREIDSA